MQNYNLKFKNDHVVPSEGIPDGIPESRDLPTREDSSMLSRLESGLVGMTSLLSFLTLFLIFFVFDSPVNAKSLYPIKDLDGCRNARECYLYCQIPDNIPACWSYGKFILSNVLGESSVNLTYPVAELGNCSNPADCYNFCAKEENRQACQEFGRNKGLIKNTKKIISVHVLKKAQEELGCSDHTSCKQLCAKEENREKCKTFGQKNNLISQTVPDQKTLMTKAKKELNCTNETACISFCEKEENRVRCLEFIQKTGLIKEDEIENEIKIKKEEKKVLKDTQTELGCDSTESCAKLCALDANSMKCLAIARKYKLVPPNIQPTIKVLYPNLTTPSSENRNDILNSGCKDDRSCREICERNPSFCPGFPANLPSPTTKPPVTVHPSSTLYPTVTKVSTQYPNQPTISNLQTDYKSPTPKPTEPKIPTPTIKPSTSGSAGVNYTYPSPTIKLDSSGPGQTGNYQYPTPGSVE